MNEFWIHPEAMDTWVQKEGTVWSYRFEGEPLVNRSPRFGTGKCYDSQRRIKNHHRMLLTNMHGDRPLIEVPLRLKMNMFWEYPTSLSKAQRALHYVPKSTRPDFDNIVKFYCDIGNGTVWKDDGLIYYAVIGQWYGPESYMEMSVIF